MKRYMNPHTRDVRSKVGWKMWAENFYSALAYDDYGRDTNLIKNINVTLPSDWWDRVQKTLRLELID